MASSSKWLVQASKPTTANDLLDNSLTVLQAAGQLAPLIPVPFVASIFVSATVIVDAARSVKQNKLNCAKLAKRVADLAHDVHKEIHGREDYVDDRLNAALQQLQDKLSEIQLFMQEEASKSTLHRIISRGDISTRITELAVELDYVMRTFKTTALIRMELHMAEVSQKLAVIGQRANEERKWDGEFRIYRLSELYLQRLILRESFWEAGTGLPTYVAEYYQAEVKDRVAVVKVMRGRNQETAFRNELMALKGLKHPNVVQLQGYSNNETEHFIVLKGDLVPAIEYMQSLSTDERNVEYFRIVAIVHDTEFFLNQRCLDLSANADALLIDARSRQPVAGSISSYEPSLPFWQMDFESLVPLSSKSPRYVYVDDKGLPTRRKASAPLYRALLNFERSERNFNNIVNLYKQADVHRVITRMSPWDGFSEHSPAHAPVGTFGYVSQESTGIFIPLGHHPCVITELCKPDRSTYSPNDWRVANGEMLVSASIEQARLCNPDPFVFLCEHGPALSSQHSLKMHELMIVTSRHLKIEIKVKCEAEKALPYVFFHLLPFGNGPMPDPCGYFSYSPDRLYHDAENIPMVEDSAFFAEVTSFYKIYKSTLPGLIAHLSQDAFFEYGKLNEFQGHMAKWVHSVYAPEVHPKSEIHGHGEITEVSS